ncbi:MAG: hypothetical protein NTU53_24510 [Planctomycetota bacterium]|nr:hypothetical protein [Planctomycetota bacterium]
MALLEEKFPGIGKLVALKAEAPPSGEVKWHLAEDTFIIGLVSSVRKGTAFKTATGNIYQVTSVVIELTLELNPKVRVLTNGSQYRLMVQGVRETLMCKKLNEGTVMPMDGDVVESRIDAEFEGFESGRVFKLSNGQVWEQVGARYRYVYKYSPRVVIIRKGSICTLIVDGLDDDVTVRLLYPKQAAASQPTTRSSGSN